MLAVVALDTSLNTVMMAVMELQQVQPKPASVF
jgi:hypothetical protein